jgi:hypothetical protein
MPLDHMVVQCSTRMIQTVYPTIEKSLHINVLGMVLREIIGAPGTISQPSTDILIVAISVV